MTFQISSTLLDTLVLSLISQKASYGYEVTQNMRDIVNISESTLYPVLRRLKKSDLLETYDLPHDGRNRRYYKITHHGKNKLEYYTKEWQDYISKINKILQKENVSE